MDEVERFQKYARALDDAETALKRATSFMQSAAQLAPPRIVLDGANWGNGGDHLAAAMTVVFVRHAEAIQREAIDHLTAKRDQAKRELATALELPDRSEPPKGSKPPPAREK